MQERLQFNSAQARFPYSRPDRPNSLVRNKQFTGDLGDFKEIGDGRDDRDDHDRSDGTWFYTGDHDRCGRLDRPEISPYSDSIKSPS